MRRKIITALAVLAAFSACREKPAPEHAGPVEYRFDIVDEGTRAALSAEGVYWQEGDRVGLFAGGTGPVPAAVDVSASPAAVVFSSSVPLPEGTLIHAFYPFGEGPYDAASAPVVFPTVQEGFSVSAMPMASIPARIAAGDDGMRGSLSFLNLGAVIDFRVFSGAFAGERVESILFVSDGGPVSGKATLDLAAVDPAVPSSLVPVWTDGKPYTVLRQGTVVAPDKDAAALGQLFLVLAPGTYSGTIQVVTDAAVYAFPFSGKVLPRSSLTAYNLELKESNRQAAFNLENDRVRAFLDQVEASPYDPADYSYSYIDAYCTDISETNRLDWPKPVPVRWSNPSAGNGPKQVMVFNDAAMTDLELSLAVEDAAATSADVYNLIPGRTYYYKVASGKRDLTAGAFRTTGRRRMLKVGESTFYRNNAVNCRDFGGQVTADGRRLRFGKIFRGSNMDDTSAEAKECLLNYLHVGLDVDLRKKPKQGSWGEYINDALELGEWHLEEPYDSWGDLTSLDKLPATLNRILDVVNDPDSGRAVYIHCKVGADRTGYVCMLLEAILGVPQGSCDVDYEMTSFTGPAINENPRTRIGNGNYYYRTKVEKPWWGPETVSVRGVDFISTMPGETFQDKAVYYLTNTLGIDPDKIAAFQDNMLE